MKQTVNSYEFEQAFRNCGRFGGDNDNFSYEALQLLFEYFEELEESCDMEIELDPISICCDFTEATKAELVSDYEIELNSLNTEDEDEDEISAYLQDNTSYVGRTEPSEYSKLKEPTFIYQSF